MYWVDEKKSKYKFWKFSLSHFACRVDARKKVMFWFEIKNTNCCLIKINKVIL